MGELKILEEREILGKEVKMYGELEKPLFLAKEVAKWIENKNVSQMLNIVDEEEKAIYNVYTLGGLQDTWFLTEDGLYEVLMQSRKPIAKQFKKEVKKILKQIRQTGGYIPYKENMSNEEIVATALKIMDETIKKKDKEIEIKQEVIYGLTEGIPLPEKRQRINQIIKYGGRDKYCDRYNLVYSEFEKTHGINVGVRLNHAIEKGLLKPNTTRMEFICNELNMTDELYEITCKIFQSDAKKMYLNMAEAI